VTVDIGKKYQAIVMGASAGGLYALTSILEVLPAEYPIPIVVVQHRFKDKKDILAEVLQHKCKIKIKQADEKEKIENSIVYIAPPNYHLLVESDLTFSLSSDEQMRYSKPSVDVLFESAAAAYGDKLIGIVLTGANNDGAAGISAIKKCGGLTISQDPKEAISPEMPIAAIETKMITYIWTLAEIKNFLLNLQQ
jgi:two-component system, chemotaxis family, protein-glutamate methylesterase/glutaminase